MPVCFLEGETKRPRDPIGCHCAMRAARSNPQPVSSQTFRSRFAQVIGRFVFLAVAGKRPTTRPSAIEVVCRDGGGTNSTVRREFWQMAASHKKDMRRKKQESVADISRLRPMPPEILFDESNWTRHFVPADGLAEWVAKTLMDESSPLYNEDHNHLHYADIEYLWAAVPNNRQMRRVVGQCEEVTFRCGAWQKGRQEQQMKEWFGRVPAYLITLDAHYARECSDAEFCALVEHELYHIAHKLDEFEQPAFTKDGLPKIGIQSHDVEEFVGIVRRYGVGAAAGKTVALVEAAKRAPEIGNVDIARMCGTCLLRAA